MEIASSWHLAGAAGGLWALVELLAGDPRAPISFKDELEIVDLHVADSLSVLGVAPFAAGERAVDIGSGAGLPGLPLAVARSAACFDLLEAARRKVDWIAHAVTALSLQNALAVHGRAEEWAAAPRRESYDIALARALAPLPTVLEYASPLLRVGGRLVVWRGAREPDVERRANVAAARLGLAEGGVERVVPFPAARHRHLHLYRKDAPCPPEFPRRPGMARKRPLGSGSAANR